MKIAASLIASLVLSLGVPWTPAHSQTSPDTTVPGAPPSPATSQVTTDTTGASPGTGTVIETRIAPTRGYTRATERARRAASQEVTRVDSQLRQVAVQIDRAAARDGDAKVAERLAADFKVSADTLTAHRSRYGVGWGDLLIAHTLHASRDTTVADSVVTLDDIFRMRSEGKMGWGQIASGLDLQMGTVVSSIRTQSRVAGGQARPDGVPERIPRAAPAGAGSRSGSQGSPQQGTPSSGSGPGGQR
jgi:hypothetical protein